MVGFAAGQNKIIGQLEDTSLHLQLPAVSVTLMESKDSFIISDTRTSTNGAFVFKHIKDGAYLILYTYPGYADQFQSILCKSDSIPVINLGKVNLVTKLNLLQDVIVKTKLGKAITIRGDTTEYTADSFIVQKNANVEDLLKQLPGIQIDQYGNIKGQGKAVHKVLVDGEEFFGNDPLLVTRNLRAAMVDKVQLFDQKSDQALFTGIDDGIKNKTINITLKENKKHGQFGKILAEAGTHNIYGTRAMANAFKGKQKMAAYITAANNGITDLASADQGTFGSVAGASGHYEGEGIPTSVSTGGHYNNSWNDKSHTINGDYKFNQLQVKNQSSTINQNLLPDNDFIITKSASQTQHRKDLHLINISSDLKIDSTSTLKIAANGQMEHDQNSSQETSTAYRNNQTLLNESQTTSADKNNSQYVNTSAHWLKRFKKNRRTLSAMINLVANNRTGFGTQNSMNDFYSTAATGGLDSSQHIELIKRSTYRMNQYAANITYTEPLTQSLSMVTNYGHDQYNTRSYINSYNQLTGYNLKDIDSLYSNHFIYRQITNHLGIDFIYAKKKVLYTVGNRFNQQTMRQTNLFNEAVIKKSYLNWSPHAKLTFNLTAQKSMSFNYNGSSSLPTVTQLQPIVDNTNPLYLFIGNTNLRPSFSNRLAYDYNAYNTQENRYLNINLSYGLTSHAITSNIATDTATGKTLVSYLNAKSTSNTTFYGAANYSFAISKVQKINLSVGGEIQNNQSVNFINDIQNTMHVNSYALTLGLNKTRTNSYDLAISNALGYIINRASIQNTINNNYWVINSSLAFNYYLPAHFQFHTDLSFSWQDKSNMYNSSFNKTLCNSWIGRKFLKDEQLMIKISANDIFNQNTGFSRNAYNNIITQHRFLTIGRNFGLSIIWDFKNFKTEK